MVYHVPGQPVYEGFLPYLPLMTVFGLPSAHHHDVVLTDARIFFSLATLAIAALALWLCPADGRRKMRTLQVIAILPTAALPLATGGDDMPVVALLLLAMVLAQRRQPFVSGLVLGVVSAMKFTAWPLAALALFAAKDHRGRRRPGKMFLGMLVVAGPVVVPFALRGPWAFFDNVVLFPLGLSGVSSPPASPLPGHLLVTAFPFLHRALPLAVGIVGGIVLAWHLWRKPPQTTAQMCHTRWRGDGGAVPPRPGDTHRLPALPDQLLCLDLSVHPVEQVEETESIETRRTCARVRARASFSRGRGPGRVAPQMRSARSVAPWVQTSWPISPHPSPNKSRPSRPFSQHLEGAGVVGGRPVLEHLPSLGLHVSEVEGVQGPLRCAGREADLCIELVGRCAVVLVGNTPWPQRAPRPSSRCSRVASPMR